MQHNVVDIETRIRKLAESIYNLTGANESDQAATNNSFAVPTPSVPMIKNTIAKAHRPQAISTERLDTTADSTAVTKPTRNRRIPTRVMVLNAIKTLNEPDGSSLRKIKSFVYKNYDVNRSRVDLFIRKYLKKGYLSGELIQKKRKPFNINRKFRIASK